MKAFRLSEHSSSSLGLFSIIQSSLHFLIHSSLFLSLSPPPLFSFLLSCSYSSSLSSHGLPTCTPVMTIKFKLHTSKRHGRAPVLAQYSRYLAVDAFMTSASFTESIPSLTPYRKGGGEAVVTVTIIVMTID